MAELDSWAVGATTDRRVGTEDARRAINLLLGPGNSNINAKVGIRPTSGDPGKVEATGTPGPNVTVRSFQAVLDLAARPGSYLATLDAQKTVSILDVPADPTNQRNDLIIAQQNDADYGDANRNFQVIRVTGTPSGSPVDPTPSGSANYFKLARVRVTAGATTVTNAMIDDLRPGWIAALGGVLLITNATDRATITPYQGMPIYRLDRNWIEVYDGATWRVQGIAICSSTADRDSAITSPYNGLQAFTTDTNTLWVRASGAWVKVSMGGGLMFAFKSADESVTSSTTLQNDDHLLFAVEANARYKLDGYLSYTGAVSPAGDLKIDWTIPAGASMKWASFAVNSNALTSYDVVVQSETGVRAYGTLGAQEMALQPKGWLVTAGTAGTLQMRWAQNASSATATVLKTGSYLELKRVG